MHSGIPIPLHGAKNISLSLIDGAAEGRGKGGGRAGVFRQKETREDSNLRQSEAYNPGQNIMGHFRKLLSAKAHFAKLTHILPLKKA